MIRGVSTDDTAAIRQLAYESGLFQGDEIDEVIHVLENYLAGDLGEGHEWIVFGEGAATLGVAYFAPEALSNGVWNLYFIAVMPEQKGKGIGRQLIDHVERRAAQNDARLLIVETSGAEKFGPTWAFYRNCGFEEAAALRDYYGPNEAKVIFLKDIKKDRKMTQSSGAAAPT